MVRREGRVGCCRINELYQSLHNIAFLDMAVFRYNGALAVLALLVGLVYASYRSKVIESTETSEFRKRRKLLPLTLRPPHPVSHTR